MSKVVKLDAEGLKALVESVAKEAKKPVAKLTVEGLRRIIREEAEAMMGGSSWETDMGTSYIAADTDRFTGRETGKLKIYPSDADTNKYGHAWTNDVRPYVVVDGEYGFPLTRKPVPLSPSALSRVTQSYGDEDMHDPMVSTMRGHYGQPPGGGRMRRF